MTIKLLALGGCCLQVLVVVVAFKASAVQGDVSYQCTLSDPIEIDDGVTLEHVKNVDAGTYTMRWTYNGGLAWIGVGINTDDSNKMTPGVSVIGRADDEEGAATSVYKYALESDAKDGSGVVPLENQNLMDASFVQTTDSDGTSTLMFTQYLEDDGITITDESSWIYAIGLPDNQWEGKHKIHGSFQLSLKDGCVKVTKPPTPNPTPSPTPNPTTRSPTTPEPVVSTATATEEEPVRQTDLMNDQEENAADPQQQVDEELEEEEEEQQEDEAFEEEIEDEDEEKEEEEEETATTVFVNPTSTNTVEVSSSSTTTTTAAAAATGTTSSSSSSSSGFIKKQDVTEETHGLWKAHGWTLTIAWGLFAPLAVGVSILRHTVGRFGGTSWYNLHFYLNLVVVGLTVIGFVLAVAATQQEEKPHFEPKDDTSHHPVGLVLTILVVGQCLWAYFRPPAPKPPSSSSTPHQAPSSPTRLPSKDHHAEEDEDTTELALSQSQLHVGSPTRTTGTSSSLEAESDDSSNEATSAASVPLIRKIWEIQHRLTGVCMVAMAWYNCHSGYQLMEENYDDNDNHTTLFWGVTGAIGSFIFVLSYGFKMR